MTNATEYGSFQNDCLPWINQTSEDVLRTRFYLISVFASSLAGISILENIILVRIFLSHFKGTHFLYLTFVAIFDIIHASSYVLTMGIGIMYEYWQDWTLKNIWITYLIPVFTLSHVILCASSYLLVAASFERCLTTHRGKEFCTPFKRGIGVLAAIFIGTTTKGTIYWEFKVVYQKQCPDTDAEYIIVASELILDPDYRLYWAFYYRNIVACFMPFCLLVALNSAIVLQGNKNLSLTSNKSAAQLPFESMQTRTWSMNRKDRLRIMVSPWLSKARANLRKRKKKTEKFTFAVIIGEHLFLVSLSVFIRMWEFVDNTSLMIHYNTFWTIATDMISIFTIVACAIRHRS